MKKWNLLFLMIVLGSTNLYAKEFSDRELSKHIEKEQTGIIYLWSQGMPLSLKGLAEAQKITQKLKISFLPVTDKNDLSQSKLTLNSHKLMQLGAYDHFPAIIIFKDGKLIENILHGYESPLGLEIYINQYLTGKLR